MSPVRAALSSSTRVRRRLPGAAGTPVASRQLSHQQRAWDKSSICAPVWLLCGGRQGAWGAGSPRWRGRQPCFWRTPSWGSPWRTCRGGRCRCRCQGAPSRTTRHSGSCHCRAGACPQSCWRPCSRHARPRGRHREGGATLTAWIPCLPPGRCFHAGAAADFRTRVQKQHA